MALISIGRAILRPNGLSASELEATSETRVPGKATFAGMDYQLTGQGERLISFGHAPCRKCSTAWMPWLCCWRTIPASGW